MRRILIYAFAIVTAIAAIFIYRDTKFIANVKDVLMANRIKDNLRKFRLAIAALEGRNTFTTSQVQSVAEAYELNRGRADKATTPDIQQFYTEFFSR